MADAYWLAGIESARKSDVVRLPRVCWALIFLAVGIGFSHTISPVHIIRHSGETKTIACFLGTKLPGYSFWLACGDSGFQATHSRTFAGAGAAAAPNCIQNSEQEETQQRTF